MNSDQFVAAEPSVPGDPNVPPEGSRPRAPFERLTARERDVVARALRGSANKVIAYDLGLAHSTVRVLMARAATKLGAHSRDELLRIAAEFVREEA
jgi:DNA-binding NarL/FixJ family response regulator